MKLCGDVSIENVTVLLAGMAAEEFIFGQYTACNENDLTAAMGLLTDMVSYLCLFLITQIAAEVHSMFRYVRMDFLSLARFEPKIGTKEVSGGSQMSRNSGKEIIWKFSKKWKAKSKQLSIKLKAS